MLIGSQASAPQRRLDAERAQHLDGVGPELDAGADLAELAGALVDIDLDAALAQRAGRRKPAEARPDHRHSNASAPSLRPAASRPRGYQIFSPRRICRIVPV